MCDFVHHVYDTGGSKATATCALFGCIMITPSIKSDMPLTRRSLRGWTRKHPPKPYPPLTWDLTVLIAVRILRQGHRRAAIGVLLAFDCYLRIGELVGLRHSDIADIDDARQGSGDREMVIGLRHTKTGPNKWVTVADPEVATLVRSLLRPSAADDELVFGLNAAKLRRLFKQACEDLGLSPLYVPHSLRHGAA